MVLQDPPSLRILRARFDDRTAKYSEATRLFSDIGMPSQLCLLVDFDILCAFIYDEPAGAIDSNEVRFFFHHSRLPYRLPVGAYDELRKHLNDQGFFELHIERGTASLLESLIPKNVEPIDIQSFSTPDDRLERITYLSGCYENLRVALDPSLGRFRGIAETYDEAIFNQVLERLERYYTIQRDYQKRDRNNQNDAKNLSIALDPWINNGEGTTESFLLLTATQAVHETASEAELRIVADGHKVTVTPNQVAMLEWFDFVEDPTTAIENAREYRDSFQQMADRLSDQLKRIESPDIGAPRPAIDLIQKQLKDSLRSIVREKFTKIEQKRSSFSVTAHTCLGFFSDTHSHIAFIKTIDGLRKLLDELCVVDYAVLTTNVASNLIRHEIRETDPFNNEPLSVIEEHLNSLGGRTWKATWRLEETQEALVSYVDSYFDVLFPTGSVEENLVNGILIVSEERDIPQTVMCDGVVIELQKAYIAITANWMRSSGNSSFLRYYALRRLVLERANQETDPVLRNSLLSKLECAFNDRAGGFRINKIQINFLGASLEFECHPHEAYFRTCTLTSSQLSAEFVTNCYKHLGPRVILQKRFRETLQSIFENERTAPERRQ